MKYTLASFVVLGIVAVAAVVAFAMVTSDTTTTKLEWPFNDKANAVNAEKGMEFAAATKVVHRDHTEAGHAVGHRNTRNVNDGAIGALRHGVNSVSKLATTHRVAMAEEQPASNEKTMLGFYDNVVDPCDPGDFKCATRKQEAWPYGPVKPQCPGYSNQFGECGGHGWCVDGECRCYKGYTGEKCDEGSLVNCDGHPNMGHTGPVPLSNTQDDLAGCASYNPWAWPYGGHGGFYTHNGHGVGERGFWGGGGYAPPPAPAAKKAAAEEVCPPECADCKKGKPSCCDKKKECKVWVQQGFCRGEALEAFKLVSLCPYGCGLC